ncbi:hypothetical protein HanOQP8_Chr10g0354871 [Helianthus annuus]|nr:hypothetical protein HanOQP8_Chr10g0354871 [Helianthus annuus]KAJ0882618.1 hypothetical protein HanPSC8_Chr10g0411771 [Helianthus annuus]
MKWVVVHGNMLQKKISRCLLKLLIFFMRAEFGFAAHWRYKEGDCMHSTFVLQMVEWARWVVTWQCETMMKDQSSIGYTDDMKPPCKFRFHSEDCPHSYKPSCGSDGPVFVIVIENNKVIYMHNNLSYPLFINLDKLQEAILAHIDFGCVYFNGSNVFILIGQTGKIENGLEVVQKCTSDAQSLLIISFVFFFC